MFDKIWEAHVVSRKGEVPALLYIDLHLVHEVSSAQAFDGLRKRGVGVRRPGQTMALVDHAVPTTPVSLPVADHRAAHQIRTLEQNCREYGIPCFTRGHERQGIVHVVSPELGMTRPGMTIVCGDSHTSTHGALGALAFGIGTSEVEQVLATQCLLQSKPRAMEVRLDGVLAPGVTSKDLVLYLIAEIGTDGATGHVIEYRGSAIEALSVEARMTVCNMSIEAGARAGMIAPDDRTIEYLARTELAAESARSPTVVDRWKGLASDEEAMFSKSVMIDITGCEPMVTYGTTPAMTVPISGIIPDPADLRDPAERASRLRALQYMGLTPCKPVCGLPVNVAFFGSCTNGRIEDLRLACRILDGRKVAPNVRAFAVPGSRKVKLQAEAEGLDTVFRSAGVDWREPGCSMCLGMNGDILERGQYAVSTSNRNFEGRQGPGGRTFLASPLTAAASAVLGCLADPRDLL